MKIGIYDPYLDTLGGGERYMLTAAECLSYNHNVSVFWNDNTILTKAKEKFGIQGDKITLVKNIFSQRTNFLQRLQETASYDSLLFLSDGSIPFTMAKKTILHFQFPVECVNADTLATKIKLKRIDSIIVNSEYTKQYIDKKFHLNSKVIYPPCPMALENKETKTDSILTVGRFQKMISGDDFKKFKFLIETYLKMNAKEWKFVIAVSVKDEDHDAIQELIEITQDTPIEIKINTSFRELEKLYSQAKIYWHAAGFGEDILRYPERAEHFGISTVEAMSYGVVPVVIDRGGQREIVENGISGFLWDTQEELIGKTENLMKNLSVWNTMSLQAKERAQKFSENNFCKKVNTLFI